MVWQVLKGSTKPTACVVVPTPTNDFEVTCDIEPRRLLDKEKVCLIEIRDKPYVMCGKGSEVLAHLYNIKK
ncbi:MAG: hypothetical protein ABWK05_07090 [Pyrobaculum sp.]